MCTQNLTAGHVERMRQIVGNLTSNAHHDASRTLTFVNIEHPFQAQFFKVQSIALIVICTDGFRVVIHHNGLDSILTQLSHTGHRTPVELHAASDAVRSTAQNHDALFLDVLFWCSNGSQSTASCPMSDTLLVFLNTANTSSHIVLCTVVRTVQIIRHCWELSREGINLLDRGLDVVLQSCCADLHFTGIVTIIANLFVAKSTAFERAKLDWR
mmetsp:Transcript_16518/g.24377  ORF Transcript_16518/g.24377 Transcript_16518/m.24377 type:complete len:213 (+) Transcript_16518:1530-2168(+)